MQVVFTLYTLGKGNSDQYINKIYIKISIKKVVTSQEALE